MLTVLMAVCNHFTNDNRVYRAADTIQKGIGDVTLLAYFRKDLAEVELQGSGFKVRRIRMNFPKILPKQVINLLKYQIFKLKAIKVAKRLKPEIIHCHDYNTLFLGIYCKKKFKSKFIYDNHEYFQDLDYLHRYPLFIRKRIARFERQVLKKYVDKLIVVSPGIAEAYSKIYRKTIFIVRNIPDYTLETQPILDNSFASTQAMLKKLAEQGDILLLHIGVNLSKGRGFTYTLELLKQLPSRYKLVVFGANNQNEIDKFYSNENISDLKDRIFIFGILSTSNIYLLRDYFSFGLSIIEPIYFSYKHSLPNKLFEYIAMELPVIISDIPDQMRIIEHYKNGLVAKLNDVHSTTKALLNLTLEKQNVLAATEELCWSNEKRVLLDVYEK